MMTLIIDPPSPFDGLAAWTAFRAAMERLVKAEPDNPAAREALETAKQEETRLSAG